jgi:CBS domain-containing protein
MVLAYILYGSARAAIVQSAVNERIEGVRVSDIMDTHPVAIPAQTPVTQAVDEFFVRYRQAWLPVVDDTGHLLGIARQERAQASIDGGEAWLTTAAVLESDGAPGWQVQEDRPISELLASETLGRLGALVAVDAEGVVRGVVTVDQVRRALAAAFGRSMA